MAQPWSHCRGGSGKLVWIGAALALLFLSGTQTAFGQHNLETHTEPGVSLHETEILYPRPSNLSL